MVHIGKFNHLEIVNQVPFGFYLDGGELGQILLPTNTAPQGCKQGDWLDVFIYHDSDDRIIATTKNPKAQVDQCAYLKVVSVNNVGAFLDWGLEKDLLVPYSEQDYPMSEGISYVVYLFCDEETNRIAASTRLRDFLPEVATEFEPKQEVSLLICGRGSLAEQIIEDLIAHGGLSTLTDKSPAEEITKRFNVSKSAYKKAIGGLFKQKRILLDKNKITLIDKTK